MHERSCSVDEFEVSSLCTSVRNRTGPRMQSCPKDLLISVMICEENRSHSRMLCGKISRG
jgi:hypothetical protein